VPETPPPSSIPPSSRAPASVPPPSSVSYLRWSTLLGRRALEATPLELRLLGRVLLHAALVGVVTGLAGSIFFFVLELAERLFLERIAGYEPLRASGEAVLALPEDVPFRPWILWFLPGLGALVSGVLAWRFAQETWGGGADATIAAFHKQDGLVRKRVPFVKLLCSVLTLGTGGSGGREGPTMQIGGALGSLVAQTLRVSPRERRILLVAGMAAGMAAVFRTPLGAALLAAEVLHKDDFESDALVPSVLASVVSYSVFISFFGEHTLFGAVPRHPFVPAHLPYYALMALVVCAAALLFESTLHGAQKLFVKLRVPDWAKPGLGGLGLGLMVVPILLLAGSRLGGAGRGLGILGGGYGAVEAAMRGAPWLGTGWQTVELLVGLALVKIVATSLTVGSGGSAGDFGPSLVMTCELAGSYDLLVPLMLCEGIAFVALRRVSLYKQQVASQRESPVHKDSFVSDVLATLRVKDVLQTDRALVTFRAATPARRIVEDVAQAAWQDVFPVLGEGDALVGVLSAEVVRTLAANPESIELSVAHDLMLPPASVRTTDTVRAALDVLFAQGTREVVVVDEGGKIVGVVDEMEIARVYSERTGAPAA
jgi:CIC family chloride channel protein